MSSLTNQATASASGKDTKILAVFAALGASRPFTPLVEFQKSGVKKATFLGYLDEIFIALACSEPQKARRLVADFEDIWMGQAGTEAQKTAVSKVAQRLSNLLPKAKDRFDPARHLGLVFKGSKGLSQVEFLSRLQLLYLMVEAL